jgi:hypothetical protein
MPVTPPPPEPAYNFIVLERVGSLRYASRTWLVIGPGALALREKEDRCDFLSAGPILWDVWLYCPW